MNLPKLVGGEFAVYKCKFVHNDITCPGITAAETKTGERARLTRNLSECVRGCMFCYPNQSQDGEEEDTESRIDQ